MPALLPVLLLFGPTASGKTKILEELFASPNAALPAEIISADSMQVYRGMDIGTAKPGAELLARLPHHLIDIRSPNEAFSAGDFVRLADEACADISRRGKLPVVSGGTGFYLKNFVFGLSEVPPADTVLREALKEEYARNGAEALMEELRRGDPQSARRIHLNDTHRLLRALEVLRSGRPLSSFGLNTAPRGNYRFCIVELTRPRDEVYRRIEMRCVQMFSRGLYGEVEGIFQRGYTPGDPGMRAIGYREFFVEKGDSWGLSSDREGVRTLIARNSRHYAKRQLTYFEGFVRQLRAIEGPGMPGLIQIPAGSPGVPGRILDLLNGMVHT
jgi:tRNA dimethylallyltransferase